MAQYCEHPNEPSEVGWLVGWLYYDKVADFGLVYLC
jgi:hypothetical protein